MTAEEERVGLCTRCRHTRRVRTRTGATFYFCELSQADPRYPKYPNLPVRSCTGYEVEDENAPGDR